MAFGSKYIQEENSISFVLMRSLLPLSGMTFLSAGTIRRMNTENH